LHATCPLPADGDAGCDKGGGLAQVTGHTGPIAVPDVNVTVRRSGKGNGQITGYDAARGGRRRRPAVCKGRLESPGVRRQAPPPPTPFRIPGLALTSVSAARPLLAARSLCGAWLNCSCDFYPRLLCFAFRGSTRRSAQPRVEKDDAPANRCGHEVGDAEVCAAGDAASKTKNFIGEITARSQKIAESSAQRAKSAALFTASKLGGISFGLFLVSGFRVLCNFLFAHHRLLPLETFETGISRESSGLRIAVHHTAEMVSNVHQQFGVLFDHGKVCIAFLSPLANIFVRQERRAAATKLPVVSHLLVLIAQVG
ncbi:MAG: hypothetical protein BJ554DRAFT_4932, partial [Olpidium bornovanus]